MRRSVVALSTVRLVLLGLLCSFSIDASVLVSEDLMRLTEPYGQSRKLQQPNVQANIAGGEPAPCGRFPYMASLRTLQGVHACGGVLVDPNWVLTAAHCVYSGSVLFPNMVVIVGGCNQNDEFGKSTFGQFVEGFRSVNVAVHPDWTGAPEDGSDIALVKLSAPSRNPAAPYAMRSNVLENVQTVTAIGWGRKADGTPAEDLQHTDSLNILANRYCDDPDEGWGNIIKESMVCAVGQGRGIDTCRGDSGGPLLLTYTPGGVLKNGHPDLDILVGITSFGKEDDCGESDLPGVYTRVSSFAGWITQTIAASQETAPVNVEPSSPQAVSNPVEETEEDASQESPAPPVFEQPEVSPSPVSSPPVNTSSAADGKELAIPAVRPSNPGGEIANSTLETTDGSSEPGNRENEDCACSEDGVSSGLETGLGGCHRRLPEGVLSCYVSSDEECTSVFESVIYPGALWIVCMDDQGLQELPKESGLSEEQQSEVDKELARFVALPQSTGAEVRDLILRGASPNAMWRGHPVLHVVAGRNNLDIALALVEAGAKIDATDDLGTTALHLASSLGHIEFVEFLVKVGADVSIRDGYRQTPQDAVCTLVAACPLGTMDQIQSILSRA